MKRTIYSIAGITLIALFMGACMNPTQSSQSPDGNIPEGQGALRISVGADTNARTVFPKQEQEFAQYELRFSSDNGKTP